MAKMSLDRKRVLLCAALFTLHSSLFTLKAQDVIVNPDISYAGTPRTCTIGGLAVEGVEGYEDYVLTGLSGLSVGQEIEIPGTEVTEAVKRYWKHGLFSRVQITADSLVGSKIYLCIPMPAFRSGKQIDAERVRGEIIPRVRKVAESLGLETIDFYSAFDGKGELFPDKIHPNAEGAKLMAEIVAKKIAK